MHGKNAIELYSLPGEDLPVFVKGKAQDSAETLKNFPGSSSQGEGITARHHRRVEQLKATAMELTESVQCIGMHKAVPFDQLYQPTKLLFRSGMSIAASAAFGEQNRAAQSIAVSRGEELHSMTVENFLLSPENSIVFAGPGWGKTTFLHHLFRRKSTDSGTQTIMITLRREGALGDLEEIVKFVSLRDGIDGKTILLLVDGYDEVPLEGRRKVSEYLLQFAALRRGRFILTCRDHYQVIGLLASHVRIDSFDQRDKYSLVKAFLSAMGSRHDSVKMVNDLEGRQFSDFLSHPLLLALACIVKCGSETEQPRSAIRLLSRALATLQYTWDADKGVSREKLTALDGEDRMQILKRVAFASSTPFMRSERAELITRQALDRMQISRVDPVLVLQETAQFYGILVPSSQGWEFVHRSIQDFLAARHWVNSGRFVTQRSYEWNTRTAYAACLSGDATGVLEGALASPDGLTCAVEVFTNAPDFDIKRIGLAVEQFYNVRGRTTVFESTSEGLAAILEVDLFPFFSPRFLNHLIEVFTQRGSITSKALIGFCIAEVRERRLRLDFSTFNVLRAFIPNLRFQYRLGLKGFVTAEMARPI